jgi:hypothetical protein
MAFCFGTPKWEFGSPEIPKIGIPRLWGPITLCENLWLRWGLKQSCSPCWEIFNSMWHATFTQGNRVNSWLLMVGSQTANLTPSLSFGHNLCFKCPNESCKPILDIYISMDFQWYKKLFNVIGFDPWNRPLKIWKLIGTPTPEMGVHLGVWRFIPSHSFAFLGAWNVTLRLLSWLAILQAVALVVIPRLRLWHSKSYSLATYAYFSRQLQPGPWKFYKPKDNLGNQIVGPRHP